MVAKHWKDKRALNPGDAREPAAQPVTGSVTVADNFKLRLVLITDRAHLIFHSEVYRAKKGEARGYVSAASDIRLFVDATVYFSEEAGHGVSHCLKTI